MSAITPFDDLFNQSIFLNQNLLLAGKHSHFFYLPVHLEVEVLWPTVLATWEAGYEGDSQLDLAVLVELNQGRRQIEGAAEVGHYEEVLLPLKQNVHFNTHHRTIWKIQIEICQLFCIWTLLAQHTMFISIYKIHRYSTTTIAHKTKSYSSRRGRNSICTLWLPKKSQIF